MGREDGIGCGQEHEYEGENEEWRAPEWVQTLGFRHSRFYSGLAPVHPTGSRLDS